MKKVRRMNGYIEERKEPRKKEKIRKGRQEK
jgi:hypothetical protein